MFAVQRLEAHGGSRSKEAIHSGQFMVSQFEAEEQDDEDEVAVPIPEVPETKAEIALEEKKLILRDAPKSTSHPQQQLAIDTSLSKLFQCMSLAYRFVYRCSGLFMFVEWSPCVVAKRLHLLLSESWKALYFPVRFEV